MNNLDLHSSGLLDEPRGRKKGFVATPKKSSGHREVSSKKAVLPADEEERLKALRRYEILDSEPEREFDDITLLASRICSTPIAMITLVDENRQWIKSKVGMRESETARDIAFCAHGILQPEVFVVKDARADERFADNPLVTGNPKIRFYAGAPLITSDGHALGMLCVQDQVPRELTTDQIDALQALSHQVIAQLELRKSFKELRRNLTEQKRSEEALRKSEKLFTAFTHHLPGFAWMKDLGGRYVYMNEKSSRLNPYGAAALGKTDAEMWPEEIASAYRANDEQVISTRKAVQTAEPYLVDGERCQVLVSKFPILDQNGSIVMVGGVSVDITGRIEAEEALKAQALRYRTLMETSADSIYVLN